MHAWAPTCTNAGVSQARRAHACVEKINSYDWLARLGPPLAAMSAIKGQQRIPQLMQASKLSSS